MPSKFDRLREGKAVQINPKLSGRLNPNDKHLELSDGRRIDVSDDPDFYPPSEQELGFSRQKEKIERDVSSTPWGELSHQFSQNSVLGAPEKWMEYFTLAGDDYINRQKAKQAVSERISEDSPITSAIGTGAGIGSDLLLTRGLSAAKAAPILTTAHAGPNILENPSDVAKDAAIAAAGGYFLDKAVGGLSKIANRRQLSRNVASEAENVRKSNILGKEAVDNANALQKQEFNALKDATKKENDALIENHNVLLNDRKNKMIQSRNEYQILKAEREAAAAKDKASYDLEVKRLNDEYKLAKKNYDDAVKELPVIQKNAQQAYSNNVVKTVENIEKTFPKDSKMLTDEIGVAEFIDNNIRKSGIAGSREAGQSTRILKSLFPEGEYIGGRELSKRYKALEDTISRSTPEVQEVLTSFKEHLGKRLPVILENNIAYSKIIPILKREVSKDIKEVVKNIFKGQKGAEKEIADLIRKSETNLNKFFRETTSADFVSKLESGELAQNLRQSALSQQDLLGEFSPKALETLKKQGLSDYAFQEVNKRHNFFLNEFGKKIEDRLARYEVKAMEKAREGQQRFNKDIKKTYGMAEPVNAPLAPEPPILPNSPVEPPPIMPPAEPLLPPNPLLKPEPVAPTPQVFNPVTEPTLPPASGFAESLGDRLEQPLLKGGFTKENLLKLGGLKYILGKAGAPLEAAVAGGYGALKGLTAPGAETARLSFKQAGIAAIEQMASRYPSYQNGVVQDPRERRSLTKEIEEDYEIPLGQKALIQSKVNRGRPLSERLQ